MARLSNAKRQRLYIARLKAAAVANAKQGLQLSRPVPRGHIVTNERTRRQIEAIDEGGLSVHAKAMLNGKALKTYYDGR
jgi:hypothetical protein